MLYWLCTSILNLITVFFGKLQVIGKDRLPTDTGFVLASTHSGWAEIIWLGCAMLPKHINYMAKKELFTNRLLSWFLRALHAFPVNREHPNLNSMRIPLELLSHGKIVGMFPSGTRKNGHSLKRGVVDIAYNSNCPIVPVAYIGPASFKFSHIFKRPTVKIIFGNPIYLSNHNVALTPIEKKKYQLSVLQGLQHTLEQLKLGLASQIDN